MNIRLVVVDLDGTLLNDLKQVSTRNETAIRTLLAQGVLVALASARDPRSIRAALPLHAPGLYYLGSGGGLICEAAGGRVLWSRHLDHSTLLACVGYLRRFENPVFLNDHDDYWVDREDARVRMIRERYNLQTSYFQDPEALSRPMMRASLAAPAPVLARAASHAPAHLGKGVIVSLASPDWLDLLDPEAGKGGALRAFQAQFGITPAQTLAIGDYDCDLALFEHAQHRVAMGNAVPALKAAATYVTGTNNADGVAQAIACHTSFSGLQDGVWQDMKP